MYTEYNSQNVNQNYNPNINQVNNNNNSNNTEESNVNKIFGIIWKVILILLVPIILFLALIQFGVINLASNVIPDEVSLNVNEIGIKKGRGYQLVSTVLPENASNKQVEYISSNPEIASVNKVTGYVEGLKVGTTTITAKTLINDRKSECIVTVEGDGVQVQTIELSNKNINLAVGYTYNLNYKITPNNATELNAKFYSSDSSVATVDSKGMIRGVREGNAIITVSTNNDSIKDTAYVTVYKKGATTTPPSGQPVTTINYPTSVKLSSNSLNIVKGSTGQLQVTLSPSNALSTLSWKSSNSNVATVNSDGLITAVGVGTADIIVSTVNNLTARCQVIVLNNTSDGGSGQSGVIKIKRIYITTSYIYMKVGGASQKLYVNIEPNNATNRTIKWSSSNSSVVSVNSSGVITPLKTGSAVITATSVDGGFKSTTTVDVGGNGTAIEVKSISFGKTKYEVGVNSTVSTSINYNPTNASYKTVSYTSSNPNIATVDNSGLIRGISVGTATITATTKQGTATAKTTVNVKNIPSTSVALSITNLSLSVNGTYTLSASVKPDNASNKTVTFVSSNPNVIKIDKNGNMKAVGKGQSIITVKPNGGGASSQCIVNVN